MSNYSKTYEELRDYLIARVPLVILDTVERERAEKILKQLATELAVDILYYTDAKQVRSLTSGNAQADVNRDPLPFVASEFRHKRRANFALGDCRRTGDDSAYTRELLNIVHLARESSSTLVLITPDPVWPRLAQFGMLVRLDFPDVEERVDQIRRFVREYRVRFPIDWEEKDIEYAATLLSGFSEVQIGNILSSALVKEHGLYKRDLTSLASQKSRLYAAVPSIQSVHVRPDLNVVGLQNLKKWLQEKRHVFFTPEEQLKKRDLTPPKGILLVGVSGCGKSLSAKMVAQTWRLPLFRFDLGTVYDKWVGESEKKMRDALQFLDNVSPCIVWVDEIEKALAVSDGGNDVGRRVLGQFLFWLQESESRVFLVATANDITSLPSELFRKGRFSELFFVDLPNAEERRSAIEAFCQRALVWTPNESAIRFLVELSEGFSYADIEYAVKNLAEQVLVDPQTKVDINTLSHRLRQIIPYSKTNAETLQRLREWGRTRAVNASISEEVYSA